MRNVSEAIAHPQVAARDTLVSQTAVVGGVETVVQTLGPVAKLSRTPAVPSLPPPSLGEHTAEILAQL